MTRTSVQEMVALTPLLTTKLHIPRRRRVLVARPRLSARLSRGNEVPLILVSAPAGFGKTTLLTDWLAADAPTTVRTAWLSLDAARQRPGRVLGLRDRRAADASPRSRRDALSLLQSSQPLDDAVVASLLNDLAGLADDLVLVLDDYHVIDVGRDARRRGVPGRSPAAAGPPGDRQACRPAAAAGPAAGAAASSSRSAPPTCGSPPDEAAAYLNDAMGLHLTADDVDALEARTEGWIAALQLAALSMQGRDDVAGFIAGFAGDDRYVVDYLAEEVLQRQPRSVRSFLLQTSILDRSPGRCATPSPAGRRQGDARGARPGEPLPRPARRSPPLVPLPPPVRRRAARAPARRAARARAGAPPASERLVRAQRRAGRGRSPTRWPATTSSGRPT